MLLYWIGHWHPASISDEKKNLQHDTPDRTISIVTLHMKRCSDLSCHTTNTVLKSAETYTSSINTHMSRQMHTMCIHCSNCMLNMSTKTSCKLDDTAHTASIQTRITLNSLHCIILIRTWMHWISVYVINSSVGSPPVSINSLRIQAIDICITINSLI